MTQYQHRTVLLSETVDALRPVNGKQYLDVTVGGGGHSEALLDRSMPSGRLIAMDRDPAALGASRARLAPFGDRVRFVHGRMSSARAQLDELSVGAVDGLVADLGVSSPQLDQAERGFSLRDDGPLDMRMDPTSETTALSLIAEHDSDALADIIYTFGEERRSRPIARAIHQALADGQLTTTQDLRRAVHRVTGPKRFRRGAPSVDPATRTFQALRMAVNEELKELQTLLAQLPVLLAAGAVVAVVSFHSLEDRLVKFAFRDSPALEPLTKKPVVAGAAEREENPRSRSAKLRAARRVEAPDLSAGSEGALQ